MKPEKRKKSCLAVAIGTILVVLLSACRTNTYGTVVCGKIYTADGAQVTVEGDDRLKLPSRSGGIVVINDIYTQHSEKTKYSYSDVDSIEAWHPASPEEVWTMIPVSAYGWCMRYVENPYINVFTYSSRGYGLYASGRMTNFYTRRIFSKTKVHILIAKSGESIVDFGALSGYGGKRWRERLCSFVADDSELCKLIRQSRRRKFEILRLLSTYKMNKN